MRFNWTWALIFSTIESAMYAQVSGAFLGNQHSCQLYNLIWIKLFNYFLLRPFLWCADLQIFWLLLVESSWLWKFENLCLFHFSLLRFHKVKWNMQYLIKWSTSRTFISVQTWHIVARLFQMLLLACLSDL